MRALMRASAAAIIELARDRRYVGGTVGVLAVLHTWTQQLNLHPHVHCLVSGGGISDDGSTWHPARRNFLVPIKALARLVRGKFRAMLQRRSVPDLGIPDAVWRTPLDPPRHRLGHRGTGGARLSGPLRLSRRSHQRPHRRPRRRNRQHPIQGTQDRPPASLPPQRRRVHAPLPQARMPRGFHKVRYFGLWHPAQRHKAARARQMLQLQASPKIDPPQDLAAPPLGQPSAEPAPSDEPRICPRCHRGAAHLHPHAHVTAGDGTMIRSTRTPTTVLVLLPRAAPRREDPCHQRNPTPPPWPL